MANILVSKTDDLGSNPSSHAKMLEDIKEAILCIASQEVTQLGNEYPELCDGTIALYLAEFQHTSLRVKRILRAYRDTEQWLKNQRSMGP